MRMSVRRATCGVVGAVAAIWLCAGHPARAGGGSGDLASLQQFIDPTCTAFGIPPQNCPKLPTISQAVLQLAGWINASPAAIRSNTFYGNIPVGPYVDAGNPSRPPGLKCVPATSCVDPLNPIKTLPVDPTVLSTLRPLAFISAGYGNGDDDRQHGGNGSATPTQLYDPAADTFLYAVGGASPANASLQSDTLLLVYDDTNRANQDLMQGQVVAKFSLPLTVLNSDRMTERQVAAVLKYKVPNKKQLDCSASTIVGDFAKTGTPQTLTPPTNIGVDCAVIFAASPASSNPHAIFQVTLHLLITGATDPPYLASIGNQATPALSPSMLVNDDPGFTPINCPGAKCILGYTGIAASSGMSIGIAPDAGPFGPPATSALANYSLCANLPRQGNGQSFVPSVAAFYSISPDGEVLLSSALSPTPPGIVCPPL